MGPAQAEINNNLETYSIVWLDASVNNEENMSAQKQLRSVVNNLRTFINPEEFMNHTRLLQQGDLTILIVSGEMGRVIIPEMQKLEQVYSIYMYCFSKETNLEWSRPYSKVKAVCNKLVELIDAIQVDQKHQSQNEQSLSMDILDRSSTELNGEFLHSQLLIDVLIGMKPNKQDQNELIELLMKEYQGNESELKIVKEFQNEYASNRAIWWYTRDSFVYRLVNKALRVRNVEMIFLMRNIIRNVYEQLRANQFKKRAVVYRGQMMSDVEMKTLRKSIGNIISFNSFLSTSLNRRVAERFLRQSIVPCSSDDRAVVIFEIEADPRVICDVNGDNRRPFAQIDEFSYYGDETEILFMVGSIFRLESIRQDDPFGDMKIWTIRMRLCGDDENDLKKLYDHMKSKITRAEMNLMSLGLTMWKMGKFDLAEKYYRQFLTKLPSNDSSLSKLYQRFGLVANSKGEYDSSLEWYEKSLEIMMKTRPFDYVNIGNTHNNIGGVHRNKGDSLRALESYNRAVSLFKEANDENHPNMASFYGNIGGMYSAEKKYLEALDLYEKSLAIQKKHLPTDHPDLGLSYNNIGTVHDLLNDYDLALDYYGRSLKIRLKSLPSQHPDIATSYRNMGLAYEVKSELEQALTLMKKSKIIYEVALPVNHPYLLLIKNDIRRVEDKTKRVEAAERHLAR
ncbi:unnamed protein product [Rotaria socialis]|uniref:Uncharacterized protein n=1 Tax=Rotaria socialis TaxID=392032 RepID=A0A817Z4N0_9BILA|nr:unnamed protein product [Rotaria socialis]CAF4326162.1 unnamed protein product [Rotaria socialis]